MSTTREKASEDIEATLRSCNSMVAIPKEANSRPLLKEAVKASLAAVISLVEKRFERLSLKDNQFEIGQAATTDEIECLWSFADMIDSNLSMSNTTKKDISNAKDFLKFFDSHCHLRKYSFQVKKCEDSTCCSPPRSPSGVFSGVSWLPDPTLTPDKAHFKKFGDLYGQDTKDSDCPSQNILREREQEPSSLFTAAKVRGVAHCLACDKPRCLFSEKQVVYTENQATVNLAIESNFSVCGSPIFPENHPLFECIRIRTSVTCEAPIERAYYSNKTLKLPPLCVHCGEKECSIPSELQQQFKLLVVLPICSGCTEKQ